MKLLSNVYVTKVGDEYVAAATGKAAKAFGGMVKMNATSAFVVNSLLAHPRTGVGYDKLLSAMLDEYDVDPATARKNLDGILETLSRTGWLKD